MQELAGIVYISMKVVLQNQIIQHQDVNAVKSYLNVNKKQGL